MTNKSVYKIGLETVGMYTIIDGIILLILRIMSSILFKNELSDGLGYSFLKDYIPSIIMIMIGVGIIVLSKNFKVNNFNQNDLNAIKYFIVGLLLLVDFLFFIGTTTFQILNFNPVLFGENYWKNSLPVILVRIIQLVIGVTLILYSKITIRTEKSLNEE